MLPRLSGTKTGCAWTTCKISTLQTSERRAGCRPHSNPHSRWLPRQLTGYNPSYRGARMSQMTPEVAKLLQQALSLSVEEQEALADSLISNLGGQVDEGVLAAWDEEIKKRIADLDSGKAKTIPWMEVRRRNLAKLPRAH